MPKPHRRQATWAPRVSIPTSLALTPPPMAPIGRAWKCLWKACRSVAQALEHEGNGDAVGTGDVGRPQEQARARVSLPHCVVMILVWRVAPGALVRVLCPSSPSCPLALSFCCSHSSDMPSRATPSHGRAQALVSHFSVAREIGRNCVQLYCAMHQQTT